MDPSTASVGDLSASDAAILRRPDVALIPLLVMACGSLALAVAQVFRPLATEHGHQASHLTIPAALVFSVLTAAFAAARSSGRGRPLGESFWIYQLMVTALLVALTVAAMLDRGVATVAFTGVLLMAPYVAFVFPAVWSRVTLAAILLTILGVHLAQPDAKPIELGTVFVLTLVGWSVGLIPRHGHGVAFRRAQLLSRSDQLTRGLSRRGILEELAYALAPAPAREPATATTADPASTTPSAPARTPAADTAARAALLVLDLDGFKQVNDERGHAAGDEILAWVGTTVAAALPTGAAFGRLGGDEFAVVLRSADAATADRVAQAIRAAVTERIGISIGIGLTPPDERTAPDALLGVADLALYEAKADAARHIASRIAPAAPRDAEALATTEASHHGPAPVVTYEALVAAGGPPRPRTGPVTFDGSWMLAGFGALAVGGAFVVASTIAVGGTTFYEQLVRYGGIPWVLACLGIGIGYRNRELNLRSPLQLPFFGSTLLVGIGVGTAALATGGGAMSPIIAGLYLKVMFDAATYSGRHAAQQARIIVGFWALVLLLGPASALWSAPFGAAMLAGAFFLGSIGRRAFDEATRARLHLANTDDLTGLLNRRGFESRAEHALSHPDGRDFAVLVIDLDGFKSVNDRLGHAAGDELLQSVAAVLREALPDAYVTGRVGGDEFMAAVPLDAPADLDDAIARLDTGLRAVACGSVGGAIFGRDGLTLDGLMRVADDRAYEVKQARQAQAGARAADGTAA